jgi:glycosyltransferase involved in cell wall biosynthesis
MKKEEDKSEKLLKIAYIIPTLDSGGAERFFVDLIKNLDKSKFIPRLILYKRSGEWLNELLAIGVKVDILEKRRVFDFNNFRAIIKKIKEDQPDIVHTQLGGDIYGVLAARLCQVKKIISTEVNTNVKESVFYNFVKKFALRFTSHVVAVSSAVAEDALKRYHLDPGKIEVIYNGIELEKFLIEPKKRLQPDKIILGSIGRLEEQKGYKHLINALAKIENKNIELRLAGAGSLRSDLEKQIKALDLSEKIKLVGLVKASSFLKEIDIFILPSLWEGMGIVLVEAMAAAKLIIASNVGGIKEVLKNEFAFLVEAGKEEDLTLTINKAIKIINSPQGMSMKFLAQEEALKRFGIKKIAKDYENLYCLK